MASMTEPRVEVGLSDLGNVFIFHKAEREDYTDKLRNETWIVRAGNHDILTTSDQSRAEAAARAICGDDRLINAPVEPEPEVVVEEPVEEPKAEKPKADPTPKHVPMAKHVEAVKKKVSRK